MSQITDKDCTKVFDGYESDQDKILVVRPTEPNFVGTTKHKIVVKNESKYNGNFNFMEFESEEKLDDYLKTHGKGKHILYNHFGRSYYKNEENTQAKLDHKCFGVINRAEMLPCLRNRSPRNYFDLQRLKQKLSSNSKITETEVKMLKNTDKVQEYHI